MSWATEDVNPSLIPNTTMQKRLLDGVVKTYRITANDGYVLHDNRVDWTDDMTNEEHILFATGTISVRYDYDFSVVTQGTYNGTPVTKVGAYELYAIAEDLVPADSIYGGGGNDHEII